MDTLEALAKEVTQLKIELEVQKKMNDMLLASVGTARTAEKTADKALAMAQEAVAFMVSQQQSAPSMPFDPMEDLSDQFEEQFPSPVRQRPESSIRNKGKSDLELSDEFSKEDESLVVTGEDE